MSRAIVGAGNTLHFLEHGRSSLRTPDQQMQVHIRPKENGVACMWLEKKLLCCP